MKVDDPLQSALVELLSDDRLGSLEAISRIGTAITVDAEFNMWVLETAKSRYRNMQLYRLVDEYEHVRGRCKDGIQQYFSNRNHGQLCNTLDSYVDEMRTLMTNSDNIVGDEDTI